MGLREDIQSLIDKKGISVSKLSRLAMIHQDTIYKFLGGGSQMTAENLDKLINVLKSKDPDKRLLGEVSNLSNLRGRQISKKK